MSIMSKDGSVKPAPNTAELGAGTESSVVPVQTEPVTDMTSKHILTASSSYLCQLCSDTAAFSQLSFPLQWPGHVNQSVSVLVSKISSLRSLTFLRVLYIVYIRVLHACK